MKLLIYSAALLSILSLSVAIQFLEEADREYRNDIMLDGFTLED